MPSLVNNKDRGIQFLDVRTKPEWELLDLNESRQHFEAEFFESVISEFTDISGFTIDYYVFTPKRPDYFYGEATKSDLEGPYRTKILMEPFKEPYMINVLGFVGDQKQEYAEMPKAIYLRDVQEQLNKKSDLDFDPDDQQPQVGDVIHCLWNDERYEITSVNSAEKVFQGRKHIWSFILKPYRVNQEGKAESDLMAEEPDFMKDFDDRNKTYQKLTLKDINKEKIKINKEASKPEKPEEVDPAFYGYKNGIKF